MRLGFSLWGGGGERIDQLRSATETSVEEEVEFGKQAMRCAGHSGTTASFSKPWPFCHPLGSVPFYDATAMEFMSMKNQFEKKKSPVLHYVHNQSSIYHGGLIGKKDFDNLIELQFPSITI